MSIPRELLWAIIGTLLISALSLSHALFAHYPYASDIPAEHQSSHELQADHRYGAKHRYDGAVASGTSGIGTNSAGKEGKPEEQDGDNTATEFWPTFFGYRLKVTDTLVAIFTALLFFATIALWLATRRLVLGAEKSSEQQLRAYISINPLEISSADREERFAQITCIVKNHGQTPAREMHYLFDFDVFPNPLPVDFAPPAPTKVIDMNGSLLPDADMKVWFNFNRLLTNDEFAAVENDLLRLHIWGKAFYRTAFGQDRHTDIWGSVGGPAFIGNLRAHRRNKTGPAFNWTWEAGHGAGD